MFCRIALCVFAVGMVVSLAVAALCVPLVYAGDGTEFGVCVATAVLSAICLVVNLEKISRQRVTGGAAVGPVAAP